jgi:hypothetical protein
MLPAPVAGPCCRQDQPMIAFFLSYCHDANRPRQR